MVLPFLLPALIGGIGTMAASAIKSSSDQKMAREQNMLNAQQSEKQWQYSEEQQERQFQYDLQTMEQQRVYDLEDRQFAIDNPTVVRGEVDYEQMVASAEKAGINPLTALRNGGSAGFSASSQPSAPLSRTAPTRHAALRHAPNQVAAPGLGGAIGDGIMGFLENFDPFADQKREMEQRLVEAQINSLNAGTLRTQGSANRPMSFNVPQWSARQQETRTASAVAGSLSGAPITPTIETPTVTNPYSEPSGLHVDPTVPDAEIPETRYGDILSNVFGVYNLFKDMSYNLNMQRAKDEARWRPSIENALSAIQKQNSGFNRPSTRKSGGGGGW